MPFVLHDQVLLPVDGHASRLGRSLADTGSAYSMVASLGCVAIISLQLGGRDLVLLQEQNFRPRVGADEALRGRLGGDDHIIGAPNSLAEL